MRARLPYIAAVVAAAAFAGTGCWSDVKTEDEQGNDSTATHAPATGPGTTEGGVAQPATPSGGPLPTAVDTTGGRAGAGAGGTGTGARDTTRRGRPPQS